MELREDQIQRYSRQILLREVGGRGQKRLLEAAVTVEGTSPAIDIALATLGISGSPVFAPSVERRGYLHQRSLAELAPDAVAAGPARAWVGPVTSASVVDDRLVRVGLGDGVVIAVPPGLPWPSASEPAEPADPVALGSFAALLTQRLLLGLETETRSVRWRNGRWTTT